MGLLERETVRGVGRASPASQPKPITLTARTQPFHSERKAQKWEKEECSLSRWKVGFFLLFFFFPQHCDFSGSWNQLSLYGRAAPEAQNFSSCSLPSLGSAFCALTDFKIRCFCFPVVSGSPFGTDMTGLRRAEKFVTSSHFGNVSPAQ